MRRRLIIIGQKINPTGLRISVLKNWESRWYADDYNRNEVSEYYKSMVKKSNDEQSTVKKIDDEGSTVKAKTTKYSSFYGNVRQFIRIAIQRITKRCILPRQNC